MITRRQIPALLGAAAISKTAFAQPAKFPSGRVNVIVPFPAGAATDISARINADASAMWGQASSSITRAAATASRPPIGGARQAGRLTMFATSAMTQAVNPALYDKLPYDPVEDFAPITRMGTSPFVLLVEGKARSRARPSSRRKLKAEPGKHNFGAGSLPARVASELYKVAAGVEAVYVGYKSNPQAIPDLQSGLLTFMMIDTVNAKIAIDRGAMRGLLLSDTERYDCCPTCRPRRKPACRMFC